MNHIEEENWAVQGYIGALLGDGGRGSLREVDSDYLNETSDCRQMSKACLDDAAASDKHNFMIFTVHRLGCAISADEVKTVITLPDRHVKYENKQPVQYCPSAYGEAIKIITSRRVLFPEGHPAYDDVSPYQYLIILNSGVTAIACDDIDKVHTIPAMAVSWRTVRDTRPWLAGMVTSTRYPVIDSAYWSNLSPRS